MYILDTVTVNSIACSANGKIKVSDTVMRIAAALNRAGRSTFTAEDIHYVICRFVKDVPFARVENAIKNEVRMGKQGMVRRGYRMITEIGNGFYQYGK
jgi:hypothetical protein